MTSNGFRTTQLMVSSADDRRPAVSAGPIPDHADVAALSRFPVARRAIAYDAPASATAIKEKLSLRNRITDGPHERTAPADGSKTPCNRRCYVPHLQQPQRPETGGATSSAARSWIRSTAWVWSASDQ